MTVEIELADISTENIKKMTELMAKDLEKLNKEVEEAEKTKDALKKDLFSIEDTDSYEYTCANIDLGDAMSALQTVRTRKRTLCTAINLMSLEVADREGELER